MIRLQTLGSLDLRAADGTSMQPVLRQTKRLALLAYLAIEKPGQFHRRDHLLGLFWPESDLKGGRASLSQAIHFLRQYLGKDTIVNRGDEEIGLNLDAISCDAAQFQVQVGQSQFAEAMELYTGPLLTGIFVGEAEGFEEWLEQKRDTLQRDAIKACSALADAAEARDDHADVAHWLRRAVAISPFDETLRRRLILALDRSGDRAAALLAYEEFEEKLKSEFESEPSAETQELMRVVRARSDAQALPMPLYNRRAAAIDAGPRFDKPLKLRPRRRFAIAVLVVMLAVAGMRWAGWAAREPKVADLPINRIAVLYFKDTSPDRQLGHLADGLTTALIDHLGNVRRIEVISKNGVRPFRGDSIPLDTIARELRVGTLVGAEITQSGGMLRVNVEIINGATGVARRTRKFERPTGELFALLDDISQEVGSFLRSTIGNEIQLKRYQVETGDVAAWQAVQKAEEWFAHGELSADRGDRATAFTQFGEAEAQLARAAKLDSRWAAPLVLKSQVDIHKAWYSLFSDEPRQAERHLADAMTAVNEALRRDADNADAHVERGRIQYARWQLLPLDSAERATSLSKAEADLTRALSLDPENARGESALSLVYHSQGRFEAARQAARRALQADAYLEDADQIAIRLFETSFEVGDDEEAGHWCDEVRRRLPGQWPGAYCDLILLGWGPNRNVDARKALYILETFGTRDSPEMRVGMKPRLAMLAAVAIGRSGDLSRAERMLSDARAQAPHDTELLYFEAAARIQLNQLERARMLLATFISNSPHAQPRVTQGRMFKPLYAVRTAASN